MPVRPVRHSDWQILRVAARSKRPLTGRALRLVPSGRTRDGAFLVAFVETGLLAFVTGSAAAPFEATYALTERGRYAAEYGEYEYELKRPAVAAPEVKAAEPLKKAKAKKK